MWNQPRKRDALIPCCCCFHSRVCVIWNYQGNRDKRFIMYERLSSRVRLGTTDSYIIVWFAESRNCWHAVAMNQKSRAVVGTQSVTLCFIGVRGFSVRQHLFLEARADDYHFTTYTRVRWLVHAASRFARLLSPNLDSAYLKDAT